MRKWSGVFLFAALSVFATSGAARAADVICYNCPPQWADFATMLKSIKADLNVSNAVAIEVGDRVGLAIDPSEIRLLPGDSA
jgi:hypothetical protein